MKCFPFYIGEKKDEPKSTNTTFTDGEMKRSGSELDSQNISDASTESLRRNQYPSFSQRPSNLKVFSVSELKSATKNFSRSVMVGEGGFGCVYKGLIKSEEDPNKKLEVAVKQLSKRGLQGHKEWVTEVNVLGVVEHPNLVKLVGYCAEDDERGIQRLLIYEYMPNGSVENHLASSVDPLSWAMRLRIAQDAARGLTYLHEEMEFQIIFRDFKSSNILLDDQWNAKLSDFGMARLGPSEGLTHVSTAVVGTMGYAAPEYIQTGRLTSKNDVWSYGVFLYELITGRRPLDRNRPKSEQNLLDWVKPYLSDVKKFRLIIDPKLGQSNGPRRGKCIDFASLTKSNGQLSPSTIILPARPVMPNARSHKMYGKAAFALIIAFLLLLTYSIFIGTVDIRSYFLPLLPSSPPPVVQSLCATTSPPLKVYMYDLPRRFNVGIMNRRSTDQTPVTARTWPPWPKNSGLKRQHSIEYWMMGSLLFDGNGGDGREAVRVSDPELADAFFVPFFSSLSFNTHGHNMTDPATRIDRQLQIDLLKILGESKYWQRSGGRDHVIPLTHPNAFRFLRPQVNASIQIVVDFGRYPHLMSNLSKDVVTPYVHVVDSFTDDDRPDPFESRTTLLFFQGRTYRKDEGIVRVKLAKVLAGYDDVHYERSVATGENIKSSTQRMRLSKFCLHPAGDTPSSCRLFDAIVSHCVPVIVSDEIELPFEDEIDYTKFSLFFSFKEALKPDYMVNQLRNVSKERWIEMWRTLKNISHHFEFNYPPEKEDAVNMLWRQVKHKLSAVKLSVHRIQRLKIPDWWRRRK